MSSNGKNSIHSSVAKRYGIVLFGLVVLGTGIAMIGISAYFYTITSKCWNGRNVIFDTGAVITLNCEVTTDIWQDINFDSGIWGATGAGSDITIPVPAHLEIKDPNGMILYKKDFTNGRISTSFKPMTTGAYIATITSLEDENNAVYKGTPRISYSFGYIKFSESMGALGFVGHLIVYIGIIWLLVLGAKAGWRAVHKIL